MKGQDPLSNRACGFPAHGLPVVSRAAALRALLPEGLLGVAHGSPQAMKTDVLEVFARPARRFACLELPALALDAKGSQPPVDVAIELVEARRGVARAEVVSPSPQHGVQVGDHLAEI